jgi:3-dehydroquinate synthase
MPEKMKIPSRVRDYEVEMVDNLLRKRDETIGRFPHERFFFFIDSSVYNEYKDELAAFTGSDRVFLVDAHESNKEYVRLADYYELLIENRFTRNDVLVAIGGGIVQDISGFIASTLYRGIRWIFVPTTLLAQADSCIGSKTSINFGTRKNLIGSFYPPDAIFIDTGFCRTLTPAYFNSGIGEIIKFHLQADPEKYGVLKKYLALKDPHNDKALKKIIWSTLSIKRSYFEEDEFDSARRNLLNYGHCFGHALESASDFSVSHGEAVIVGMGFANLVSRRRGLMDEEKYAEFEALLRRYYPLFDLSQVTADEIIAYLKQDKKRVGKGLTMILSEDVGKQCKYNDLTEQEVRETFAEFLEAFPHAAAKGPAGGRTKQGSKSKKGR